MSGTISKGTAPLSPPLPAMPRPSRLPAPGPGLALRPHLERCQVPHELRVCALKPPALHPRCCPLLADADRADAHACWQGTRPTAGRACQTNQSTPPIEQSKARLSAAVIPAGRGLSVYSCHQRTPATIIPYRWTAGQAQRYATVSSANGLLGRWPQSVQVPRRSCACRFQQ